MKVLRSIHLFNATKTIAEEYIMSKEYPWELLPGIKDYILELGKTLPEDKFDKRGDDIWIAKSAKVFDSAYIAGPCIIDEEAEVRHCAFIRGSAIVGKKAVVGNSTELKNVILFDGVQVPHYNYVGDSILGYKAHMGAGSITSNVKSDKQPVVIRYPYAESIATGLRKMGAMIGDESEIGCNCVLNPGTVVGHHCTVYPLSSVRGCVPSLHIYKDKDNIVPKNETFVG